MQEDVKQLLAFQERDLEIDKLRAELVSIPKEIAAVKKQMDTEKAALEESKKDLVHVQGERKDKEAQLNAKEESVRKHTADLNSMKSNDAYKAMMGEIEKAKQERSGLEDEILQLMDKVDQAQKVWREREALAKNTEGQRHQQISDLEAKQKSVEELRVQKQTERDEIGKTFKPALFSRYEQLRQGKKGAVIVQLNGEQCTGCHMRVSQNLMNEVKRGQTLMFCEHCSRIVYTEQTAEKPLVK